MLKLFITESWSHDVFNSYYQYFKKDTCFYTCTLTDNEWNTVFCRSWTCAGLGAGIWNVTGLRGRPNHPDMGFSKGNQSPGKFISNLMVIEGIRWESSCRCKTRGLNKVSTKESENKGKEINKLFNLYKVWQYV